MISIIIVEYQSIDEIKNCLVSIDKHYQNCEIIVSSNSVYSIQEQNAITESFPTIKWLFNSRNGGFAYAMNRGLEVANGDYLIIMNPDVLLISNLNDIIEYANTNPCVGAVAPKIIDKSGIVQDSFRKIITPCRFITRHIKRFLKKRGALCYDYHTENSPIEVDWLIGAFIMIRREAYLKIGGLDENYFLYCEDMDLCTRIKNAGYKVIYYPKSVIEYSGTRSARKSKKYTKIFLNSLFYYWRKFKN